MTFRHFAIHLAIAALGFFPVIGFADVPDQAGWDAARKTVSIGDNQVVGYVDLGAEPDEATGDPIVLIHGYTDNSRSWSLLAPALVKALPARRIVAVDLRGHGVSSAPECCYGPENLAYDVGAALEGLGIDRAHLVGHSLGSITAVYLSVSRPEMVNKLVLISSTPKMPEEAAQWLWGNVPNLPENIDPDSQFMRDWFTNPNPVPAEFLDRERGEGAEVPGHVWMGVLRGLSAMDWTLLATQVKAPVLSFWGDKDTLFGKQSQDWLKQALPQAKQIIYAGAGHNLFWEQPENVAADIVEFLQ